MNKIKFLKASSIYTEYLNIFYEKEPSLANKCYSEQYKKIMDDSFGWADFWKTNLEKTGQYEVFEIYVNAENLQKQWAKENNVQYSDNNWQKNILEAQIDYYEPDVFFAHDNSTVTAELRKNIKQKVRSIKLIIGWDGVPFNRPALYEGCDMILSCVESTVEFYKNEGFLGCYFPFGFEKQLLEKIKKQKPIYDVSFSGSIVIAKDFHNDRLKLVADASRKINLNLWVSSLSNKQLFSKRQIKRLIKFHFREYLDLIQIQKNNKGGIFGVEMYQALADSKITLNNHIDAAKNKAGNLRLFEATGVGTCLLTDAKDNLKEHFIPDVEVVSYDSIDDCIDKIKYLLSNENHRKQIANAGQKKTLENYTYDIRLRKFAQFLKQYL